MVARADRQSAKPAVTNGQRMSWGLASGAAAFTVLLSSLLYVYQRTPIERLRQRMFPDPTGKLFDAVGARLARGSRAEYLHFASVELASRAVEACERGEIGPNDALAQISSYAGQDPTNAVYELLHLNVLLMQHDGDASVQFAHIQPVFVAMADRRIDFGLADQRRAWSAELAPEYRDETTGALVAAEICAPAHLAMTRRLNNRMLALTDELIAGGNVANAVTCCDAVIDWARRAAKSAIDVDEVWVWTDGATAAHERLAIAHAREGRFGGAQASAAAAERLRDFREALYRRIEAEPINGLANPNAPRRATTARPQLYETTLVSLLSAGLAAATAILACVVGVVATGLFLLTALFNREKTPTCPMGITRVSVQLAIGAMLLAPHFIFVAGMAFNPLNTNRLVETTTLSLIALNVTGATFLALLAAAALTARAAMPDRWGRRCWPIFAAIAFIGCYGAVYGAYDSFASDVEAVSNSWATLIPRLRTRSLARVVLLLCVATPVVAFLVHAIRWFRTPAERSLNSLRLKSYLKHLAVISLCWSALAVSLTQMALLNAKPPLQRFVDLTLDDARDGVAARMGPAWRDVFAGPPTR